MKEVTKYVSDSGIEFSSRERCEAYERSELAINHAMRHVPVPPEEDGTFIQCEKSVIRHAMNEMLQVAKTIWPDQEWVDKAIALGDDLHPQSNIARWIYDSGHSAFRQAWWKFLCVDPWYRVWQQPYYAIHAEAPKD